MIKDKSARSAKATSARRVSGIAISLLCFILLSFALSAHAGAVTRIVTARFGPDGTAATQFSTQAPFAIAFNQSTKTIYVLDNVLNKVYAFDASTPGVFTPLGGNFPLSVPASNNGRALAVDNTGLPSAGNLYFVAAAAGDPRVYGYTAAGVPLGGNFPVTAPEDLNGVAVDPTGEIWVVDRTAPTQLRHFSSMGVEGAPIDISSGLVGTFTTGLAKLVSDSNGDLYLAATSSPLYKLTAASGYATKSEVASQPPGIQGLAVDPIGHNLYVSREQAGNRRIEARNSTGTLLYEFGRFVDDLTTTTQNYRYLAVNASRDEIYAAEPNRFRRVLVFSPPGSLPVATLDPVSGPTGTHATLNGKVNPEGGEVTECKFEYGLTEALGQSAPCSGVIPTDNSPHAVSSMLSNLKPQSTSYFYRLVAKNGFGTAETVKNTFKTTDVFLTGNASSIGAGIATLNGSVNPDGIALTDCKFEYGVTVDYGSTAPCTPAAGVIAADSTTHPVTAAIAGLTGNAMYHFRISATSSLGTFAGSDQTFETLGPPLVVTQAVAPVERSAATLYTEVNPRGFNTNYRFEYGKTTSYDNQAPSDFELFAGSNTLAVKGSAKLTGLEEDTTYHYRVVASSSVGTTLGPDQTFTTRFHPASCPNAAIRAAIIQAQERRVEEDALSQDVVQLTAAAPDCMALEMVSPPEKEQQPVRAASVSPDGNRVLFRSTAALGETEGVESPLGDYYVATRNGNGWDTTATILRQLTKFTEPQGFAPDLGGWFQLATEGPEQVSQEENTAFLSDLEAKSTRPFSPLLKTPDEPTALGSFAGASADLSRLYIKTRLRDGGGGNLSARYSLDDPKPASEAIARPNIYVASLDAAGDPAPLELLARDSLGKVWGGNCGARVGGDADLSVPQGRTDQRVRIQGAIATDGSRVYFSTRPSQSPTGDCSTANKMRILERTETATGPVIISAFVQNECARLAPACDATDGDDSFQGASADGTKVFFTTTRQIASSDLDTGAACGADPGQASGCDLYLYEKLPDGGHNLIQVSKGDVTNPTPGSGAKVLNSIAAISTDGSHVYFAAEGVLTMAPNKLGAHARPGEPNLYLYQRDAENPLGRVAFVGTLAPGDSGNLWGGGEATANGAYPVPAFDSEGENIGGDGHVLVFQSRAQITGNDVDGGRRDVYRYDSRTGSIQCISCLPGGSSSERDVAVHGSVAGINPGIGPRGDKGLPMGPEFFSIDRWASEDGAAIVFATAESLLPGDTNGVVDDYLWRDGQLQRLPGSNIGEDDDPTVSADGSEVVFRSAQPLLPQDGDNALDAYMARSGGGFTISPEKPICEGERCQEPFQAQPSMPAAASESASGANLLEEAPPVRCKKGFLRRKGKCVRRHPKKKHHRKTRVAGKRQGGYK